MMTRPTVFYWADNPLIGPTVGRQGNGIFASFHRLERPLTEFQLMARVEQRAAAQKGGNESIAQSESMAESRVEQTWTGEKIAR